MGGPKNPYYKTPTYTCWDSMIQRCTNKKHKQFHDYGGRGITVCSKWMKFNAFIEDMGIRPFGMVLDRIDNSRGYHKNNCRWTDRKTQQRNMRSNRLLEFNGKTKTMAEWAEKSDLKYSTFQTRIWRGWSMERALNEKG